MTDKIKIGDIIDVSITGVQQYGAFALLPDKTNGLIHISEISSEFVKDIEHFVKIGETIKVKVIDIDDKTLQAKLSLKAIDSKAKRKERRMTYKTIRRPIKETKNGFKSLKEMLPKWIENYMVK
jgi:Predicted RNA binding protein (contains ribosomal protein S1 domain)